MPSVDHNTLEQQMIDTHLKNWWSLSHHYEPMITHLRPPPPENLVSKSFIDNSRLVPEYTFTNDPTTQVGCTGDALISTGGVGSIQWTSAIAPSNDIVLTPANDGVVLTTTLVADVIKAPIIESVMINKLEDRISTLEKELEYFKKKVEELIFVSPSMTVQYPQGGEIRFKAGTGGCTGNGGDVMISGGNSTGNDLYLGNNLYLNNTEARLNPFKQHKYSDIGELYIKELRENQIMKNVELFDKVMKEVL